MKDRVAILSAGLMLMLGLAGPTAAAPRAFETSVVPFDPSPHVMPVDFPRKYVQTTPYANGELLNNGPGAASRQWYDWLKRWLLPWANARQAFDNETATFQETVRDDDLAFKAAFAKMSGDKLSKFNATHNTQVHQTLLAYVNLRGKEATQGKAIRSALERSDAAMDRVMKEDALLSAQGDLEQRASVAADKAALEKSVAESKAMAEKFSSAVGTAVDLIGAVKDPVSFATKTFGVITGAIMSAAIDDHAMELFVMDLRLEALDKAILAKQKTAAEASLREAKKLLDAATLDYVKAILDEQLIIDQETQQLDILASLERGAKATNDPNAPEIFMTLRTLHYDIMISGRTLRKRCSRYQSILNFGPGKRAADTATELDKLIGMARGYTFTDKEEWLSVAVGSMSYIQKQAVWYPKEQKFVGAQVTALRNRVDALPTDSFVQQILAKL